MISKTIQAQHLRQFLTNSHIRHVFPDSPDYTSFRHQYILDTPATPLAIARPQSAEDVALLVSQALAANVAVTVRSGGCDLYGRCYARDALAIDMRDINFVEIDVSETRARIGGGILSGQLAERVAERKLATAFGSVPIVGYVGWATHGGYGPFVSNYGMGVDQILGAKIVNCEGAIVEADSKMLQAIRGGGGTLGVIVEMTVKVYPLEKILGGMLLFESKDLTATIRRFTTGYESLLDSGVSGALGIQQNILNTPFGKCFVVGFMWSSSDTTEGCKMLEKIVSLGNVLHNTVKETTIPAWMEEIGKFAPKTAYGRNCTINLRRFTEEVVSVISEHVAKMPEDRSTLLSILQLRGPSEAVSTESVFGARETHYCLEFIATSSEQERTKAVWEWAVAFREALRNTDGGNILASTYISLTPPTDSDSSPMYGECWERLVEIKRQYDPENVFRHALPQFS